MPPLPSLPPPSSLALRTPTTSPSPRKKKEPTREGVTASECIRGRGRRKKEKEAR